VTLFQERNNLIDKDLGSFGLDSQSNFKDDKLTYQKSSLNNLQKIMELQENPAVKDIIINNNEKINLSDQNHLDP
jgi:hypothetical protein